jgi:hypothetical protein
MSKGRYFGKSPQGCEDSSLGSDGYGAQMTDEAKPGQNTWLWKGVRIPIDRELEECLEAEQAAYVARISAQKRTSDVLERKRAELLEKGEGRI